MYYESSDLHINFGREHFLKIKNRKKLTSGINQMLKNTTPVKADQLGFGFGGDTSSEGEEEIKEQPPL